MIVDYGMGNLRSVEKAFQKLGFEAKVSASKSALNKAQGVVLPGVGAFRDCVRNLKKLGLVDSLKEWIKSGQPFLGICLGYQVLFEESEEFGLSKGLGIFPGRVKKFSETMPDRQAQGAFLKVPHMGWNQIQIVQKHPVLKGLKSGSSFYFVHSYFPAPKNKSLIATETEYGIEFASSIAQGNLFASQFHPEKSQANGLRLLQNFGELALKRG